MGPELAGQGVRGASEALWWPSPNFGPRRDGLRPSMIVLHYTAMPSAEAAREWLCTPEAQVSAHYVIARDGTLWQLVAEADRAWHAGAGTWAGLDDINSRSIGIELANTGSEPFPAPQMGVLEQLMRGIMTRWSITPEAVIGHSDMAVGRKIDPGPHFDWLRLERLGLAQAPRGTGQMALSDEGFRSAAQSAGFGGQPTDEALLRAVRLRLRPWARGPLCAEDFACLGVTVSA